MNTKIGLAAWGCCLSLWAGGCEEAQYANTPPQPTQKRAVRPVPPVELATAKERDVASRAIAEAVCDRAQRCGKIGEGEKYTSREACTQSATEDYRGELDMYDCPGSIVPNAVKNCANEIRDEGCLNPVASLERVIDCDSRHLCETQNR